MKKNSKVMSEDFKLYENGKNWNNRLYPAYYNTLNVNERMYAGDQWHGVESNGLPTPVFNIFKRIINYYVSAIMAQKTSVQYSSDDVNDDPMVDAHSSMLNSVQARIFENNKMDDQLRKILLDAALSGDACTYARFDPNVDSGSKVKGDIVWETIDGANVFFGNPNDNRINFMGKPIQPYILLSFREMVSDLKKEAKENKQRKDVINNIVSDNDNEYEVGDRGRIELDSNDESAKARVVMKFYPKDVGGKTTIMCRKSTRSAVIKEEWDTKMPIYSIAWMNWDLRKNSYHGQAPGTGLVPNQIYVNKQFALIQLYTMRMAIPKLIYDKSRMAHPSNRVGEAIGIDTSTGGSVFDVANYLNPGQMSGQVMGVIDSVFSYTKETMGATDAVMGDVKPENNQAIISTIQQSVVPLENVRSHMYQLIEDMGNINNAMMAAYYGKRKMLTEVVEGEIMSTEFDFKTLKTMRYKIKADVGPSTYVSELTNMTTLDNLLLNKHITFKQYLDQAPSGKIPGQAKLLGEEKVKEKLQQEMMARQQQAEQQAQQYQMQMEQQKMMQGQG